MLRENFPNILEVVPIGIRDDEMTRDLVNIRGYGTVHIGGKCDIYVHPNTFTVSPGYVAPLDLMTFNGHSIVDDPEELMQTWNKANLTTTDKSTGSLQESIVDLDSGPPMSTLTSNITAVDDFRFNSENELLHADNLVKQMWLLIVTASIKISDVESSEAIAKVKTTIASYINSLRAEEAPKLLR